MTGPLDDGVLTSYLLGRLSPEEEDGVEKEYFATGEAYDRLVTAEDDLIDAYAAGRLGADDARRFEERFLASPERRERVAFAQALRTLATQKTERPTSRRAFVLWPLAAALPIAVAAGWMLVSARDMRTELTHHRDLQATQERERAEQQARIAALEDELARIRSISGVATWLLTPGYERDAKPPTVMTVPADTLVACLRLSLAPGAPAGPFVARVETAEGRVVASLHGLRSRDGDAREVDVVVPAASLSPGTHVIILEAGGPLEPVATYHFRVVAP